MQHHQLHFTSQCPVCMKLIHYPGDTTCPECGWLAMVYSCKPDNGQVTRLDKMAAVRHNDFSAHAKMINKSPQLEKHINELNQQQLIRKVEFDDLYQKLQDLAKQQRVIDADPILSFDSSKIEKVIASLKHKSAQLNEKLSQRQAYHNPPVTIRCEYRQDENRIEALVKEFTKSSPVSLDLSLGLAIADHPFCDISDAEFVIPVKTHQPVIIYETGSTFHLELMQRPEKTIIHYSVIHLYAYTVTKFAIECP